MKNTERLEVAERIAKITALLPAFGMSCDARHLLIDIDDLRFLCGEAEAAQRARQLAEEWIATSASAGHRTGTAHLRELSSELRAALDGTAPGEGTE